MALYFAHTVSATYQITSGALDLSAMKTVTSLDTEYLSGLVTKVSPIYLSNNVLNYLKLRHEK